MFKKIGERKKISLFLGIVIILALVGSGIFAIYNQKEKAIAQAGTADLTGWAWSSNIGWISFNCADVGVCGTSNYKVQIDLTTGQLSGYAWSSNIGWIDFGPSSGFPGAPTNGVEVNMTTGVMSGWAQSLSADGRGWDGWIKIWDAKVSGGGKIKNNAGNDGGWAWGSDVVGWIKFWDSSFAAQSVTVPAGLVCSLTASPASIRAGDSSTLTWTCNSFVYPDNACNIDNGIGLKPGTGSTPVSPIVTTTYTMNCNGIGGPSISSATVNVTSSSTPPRIIETTPR